jgi:hypothetical protein
MRNVSDEICREIKTHIFVFSNYFFENRAFYEIMWKKYCRSVQATGDNMAHAHCMLGTQGYKYTHSDCVILIAFPLQQCCTNAPHCYVIRTLPVFIFSKYVTCSAYVSLHPIQLLPNVKLARHIRKSHGISSPLQD